MSKILEKQENDNERLDGIVDEIFDLWYSGLYLLISKITKRLKIDSENSWKRQISSMINQVIKSLEDILNRMWDIISEKSNSQDWSDS